MVFIQRRYPEYIVAFMATLDVLFWERCYSCDIHLETQNGCRKEMKYRIDSLKTE